MEILVQQAELVRLELREYRVQQEILAPLDLLVLLEHLDEMVEVGQLVVLVLLVHQVKQEALVLLVQLVQQDPLDQQVPLVPQVRLALEGWMDKLDPQEQQAEKVKLDLLVPPAWWVKQELLD